MRTIQETVEWLLTESKPLTPARNPQELLQWMDKNIEYHGVVKGKIYTADEVVLSGKGHCWETTDLARQELTRMGAESTEVIFCQGKNRRTSDLITHTTTLVYADGKYFIFEWSWLDWEGVHGPYRTKEEAVEDFVSVWKEKNNVSKVEILTVGTDRPRKGGDEKEYYDRMLTWNPIKLRKE